jgi:hypothetical protein
MYRRLGRTAEARSSYEKAPALTQQEPERQFLQERIRQLSVLSGLSISGPAVDYIVKAGQTTRPKTITEKKEKLCRII